MGWRDTIKKEDSQATTGSWRDTIKKENPDQPSMLESGLEGAAQGLTGGFADELAGALDAALSKTGNLFLGEGEQNPYAGQSVSDTYTQGRDEARARAQQLETANPKSFLAGQLVGGVASPINKLGVVGSGAAAGLGMSEADTLAGQAKDAAIGGALAKGAEKAVGLVGKGLGALGDKASAVKNAILESKYGKAFLGGEDVQKYVNPEMQTDLANQLGSALEDRVKGEAASLANVRKDFLAAQGSTPVSTEGITAKAMERAGRYGPSTVTTEAGQFSSLLPKEQKLLSQYNQALSSGERTPQELYRIWDSIGRQMDEASTALGGKTSDFQQQLQALRSGIKDKLHSLSPELTAADAQMSKVAELSGLVKGAGNDQSVERFLSSLGGRNKGNQRQAVEELLQNNPEMLKKLEDFQTYQSFNTQGGFGSDAGMKQLVGSVLGGGVGAVVGGGEGGTAGTVAGALLANPRMQRAAITKVGEATKGLHDPIKQSIGIASEQFNKLAPKFQNMLQQAASRGGNAAAITHFIMGNSNPEYQFQFKDKK